jgi:hypothetical protein
MRELQRDKFQRYPQYFSRSQFTAVVLLKGKRVRQPNRESYEISFNVLFNVFATHNPLQFFLVYWRVEYVTFSCDYDLTRTRHECRSSGHVGLFWRSSVVLLLFQSPLIVGTLYERI